MIEEMFKPQNLTKLQKHHPQQKSSTFANSSKDYIEDIFQNPWDESNLDSKSIHYSNNWKGKPGSTEVSVEIF